MAIKLIKVAKELNVGLHTIVEKLHGKGFTNVEEKPTADISDEMLAVLQSEFQKDFAIKQEADKMLRPVLKKDPVATPNTNASIPSAGNNAPAGHRPLLPRRDVPAAEPVPKKEEPEMIQRERLAPLRVLARIDLEAQKNAPKQPEAPKPVAEERPQPEEKPQAAAPPQAAEPAPPPKVQQEELPQSEAPTALAVPDAAVAPAEDRKSVV